MSVIPPSEYKPSKALTELIEELKLKQGSPEDWQNKEQSLLQWLASSSSLIKVFCRGQVMTPEHHYPALLVYDPATDTVSAYAPSGDDDAVIGHNPRYFYPTIPYAGIAREVLGVPLSADIATV